MTQQTGNGAGVPTMAPEIQMTLPGPRASADVTRDAELISPSYTRSYPFVMDHGEGLWAWDVDGNKFLDLTAGIAVTSVGHSHPRVVEAIREQAGKFLHMSGTDFYYELQVELAERLDEISPGDAPKRTFFCNSGAESVEGAIKLAKYTTGRPRVISFIGAFHGRTMGALSVTGSKPIHRGGFAPLMPGVIHVPYGYCYRCPINLSYPQCDIACLDWIENEVFTHLTPPDEVAAVIVEPIQGEGGYVVPPAGFFEKLRDICNNYGIVLIADEVQSGIARTGRWWGIEHWNVTPDIICSAKGIANGLPLGAIIAPRETMDWPPGAHASTFGGNPVSCAAALATLDVIQEEGLLENAARMGERFIAGLDELAADHDAIGDVRGKGLMVAVELIDPETGDPAPALRNTVIQECFERGVLILGAGKNVVRFMPALNITAEQVDLGLQLFADALRDAESVR